MKLSERSPRGGDGLITAASTSRIKKEKLNGKIRIFQGEIEEKIEGKGIRIWSKIGDRHHGLGAGGSGGEGCEAQDQHHQPDERDGDRRAPK